MEQGDEILINQEANYALSSRHEAIISLKSKSFKAGSSDNPTYDKPIKLKNGSVAKGKIAIWGPDNLLPQNTLDLIRKNTIVPSTLDWKTRGLFSGGLCYGEFNEETKQNEQKYDQEIEDFLNKSNIDNYLIPSIKDLYFIANAFPEIILSRDRSKIVQIAPQKATHCRWSLQDDKTGLIDYCFINANWDLFSDTENPLVIQRPVIQTHYDVAETLRSRKDSLNYIYPLFYPSANESYYQLPDYYSIIASGWLDAANAIAQFKKYLMQNQITVKYHIKIPESWWEWKYTNWKSLSGDAKKKIMDEELSNFNKFLTGEKNAGKSIMTTFRFDANANKTYPGWDIIAIDDKLKSGIYIEDSQEASSHILYSLGVDATLIGTTPGKGMGAGSGSDKREAFNMYIALNYIHEVIILKPLYLARDYNKWNPKTKFWFNRPYLQILSQVTPSQRNTNLPGNGGQSNS